MRRFLLLWLVAALAATALLSTTLQGEEDKQLPERQSEKPSHPEIANHERLLGGEGMDYSAECKDLLDREHQWTEATQGDNVDRICSFWDNDAVFYFPDGRSLTGVDAIRQMIEANRDKPGFAYSRNPAKAFVAKKGDTGITQGTAEISFDGENGQRVVQKVDFTNVWKREHGKWRCVISSSR